MELVLVLHNIRSSYNVGAILRTAEGFEVKRVVLSGYTPRYNDPALLPHLREKLNRQIAKAALGAEEMVKLEYVNDLPEWLGQQEGYRIAGLENNLSEEEQKRRVFLGEQGPAERILILGEEVKGIPAEIRGYIQEFIEIPMKGRKESFNVSVAAGIAMYELT